jgi:hypothetical protein
MAYSYVSYTGDGSTTNFSIPFGFIQSSHLTVTVAGAPKVEGTDYTVSGGVLTFTTAPANAAAISIVRSSGIASRLVTLADGTVPLAADLNKDGLQAFYLAQEMADGGGSGNMSRSVYDPNADGIIAVAQGGTGASTAAGARPNLGISAAMDPVVTAATLAAGRAAMGPWGDALVTATGSTTARDLQSRFAQVFNVKDYGAVGNGSTDDTTAIQAAITAAMTAGGGLVYIPAGTFLVTNTLTVGASDIRVEGQGHVRSRIIFNPTSAKSCLVFSNGVNEGFRCGASHLYFSSTDTTYKKIAIEVQDQSVFECEHIYVTGWTGANSVGICTRGRDSSTYRRIYLNTDQPLWIRKNVHVTVPQIDLDQTHFEDLYLIANGNPCVLVEDGANLTSIVFDGYQAWVLGTHGLYWSDTTSSALSQDITIQNVRTEQGTSATSYSIYIAHNTGIQGLAIENLRGDPTRRGIYLRAVDRTQLRRFTYGGSLVALDMSNRGSDELAVEGCVFGSSSTVSLTSFVEKWSNQKSLTNSPVPETAFYGPQAATNTTQQGNKEFTVQRWCGKTSLANLGTFKIPAAPNNGTMQVGFVQVAGYSSTGPVIEGGSALVVRNGSASLISGTTNFTANNTGGVASKLQVWNQGGDCVIENRTGQTLNLVVSCFWYD